MGTCWGTPERSYNDFYADMLRDFRRNFLRDPAQWRPRPAGRCAPLCPAAAGMRRVQRARVRPGNEPLDGPPIARSVPVGRTAARWPARRSTSAFERRLAPRRPLPQSQEYDPIGTSLRVAAPSKQTLNKQTNKQTLDRFDDPYYGSGIHSHDFSFPGIRARALRPRAPFSRPIFF